MLLSVWRQLEAQTDNLQIHTMKTSAEHIDYDKQTATLSELLMCFLSWEPDVRVLGNVRAEDAANAIRAVLIERQQQPAARAHISMTEDGPHAELEVLDGTYLQPGNTPVELYVSPQVNLENGTVEDKGYAQELVMKWQMTANRFAQRGTTISIVEAASMSNCAEELQAAIAADKSVRENTYSEDAIARCKRILNMVDDYVEAQTDTNRGSLRTALMHEFERNITPVQLLEIARATGLRSYLHGVNASAARDMLAEFVAAIPAHSSVKEFSVQTKAVVPEGYVLVPTTPTSEMEEAGDAAYAEWENGHCVLAIWDAMTNVATRTQG